MFDIDDIAEVVSSAVKAATAPILAENAAIKAANSALESRLAAVEKREIPSVDGLINAEAVKQMIEQAAPDLESLRSANEAQASRIAELEKRELPEVIKGDPGEVDMDAVRDILADLVRGAFATVPVPQDGKSVDMAEVQRMVEEAVRALPAPKDGEPGQVDMEAVKAIVAEVTELVVDQRVKEAVEAIPVPKAPEPIAPDMEAIERTIGSMVKAIPAPVVKDGNDGIGLADALIDKDGQLVITMTNGQTKTLGLVVGKDGLPGKDGKTFTLDDFALEQTSERVLEFRFLNGNMMHSFEFEFPFPIYRGVFKEGGTYERGDLVTWGGSLWHAEAATSAKPDSNDGSWKLAARRGRDGKDAPK